jgi:hypothetical protein
MRQRAFAIDTSPLPFFACGSSSALAAVAAFTKDFAAFAQFRRHHATLRRASTLFISPSIHYFVFFIVFSISLRCREPSPLPPAEPAARYFRLFFAADMLISSADQLFRFRRRIFFFFSGCRWLAATLISPIPPPR